MTGLWFLPTRPLRLNTSEWINDENEYDNNDDNDDDEILTQNGSVLLFLV